MGTIEPFKHEPAEPTLQTEIDRKFDETCEEITADIDAAKRKLDDLGKEAIEQTAAMKHRLKNWLATRDTVRNEAHRIADVAQQLRAEHAISK